jgi:hypothetical protein
MLEGNRIDEKRSGVGDGGRPGERHEIWLRVAARQPRRVVRAARGLSCLCWSGDRDKKREACKGVEELCGDRLPVMDASAVAVGAYGDQCLGGDLPEAVEDARRPHVG